MANWTATSSTAIKNKFSLRTGDDIPEIPRCRRCGHRLWAEKSIVTGIGPDCRRAIRSAVAA